MRKVFKIAGFSLLALVVVIVIVAFVLLKYHRDFDKLSSFPCDYGTEWFTEDNCLIFSTNDTYPDSSEIVNGHTVVMPGGNITRGELCVNGKTLAVRVHFSTHEKMMIVVPDDDSAPYSIIGDKIIELWHVCSFSETDSKVVLEFEVSKTTYFEEGQVIKLIHNKAQ